MGPHPAELRGARAALLALVCVLLLAPAGLAAQHRPGLAAGPEDELPDPYGVEETWTSRDKLYHFVGSAAGAAAVYSGARWLGVKRWPAAVAAALVTGAVGVAREIDDTRRPGKYFSEKDLLWNAGGIAVGIWIPDRFLFPSRAARPPD